MAPSDEIYKTAKEYTKTQKLTNISTLIIQLETSVPQKILLVSKDRTNVSLLSETGSSVTPERRIPEKLI